MKKNGSFSTVILILMLIIGLSLLLYPSFANWWNSRTQSQAIATYTEKIANLDEDEYRSVWEDAVAYNASLLSRYNAFTLDDAQKAAYNQQINFAGNGIMGYIEIPSIDVYLPIYHGIADEVLQVAIGHLDWTSLPTGGENTHCVLSGHRGLPSARLFTDLDALVEGDVFLLHILDEILTYEVDQIKVVEPYDTSDLLIEEGQDYCTLLTCTPYGVNTHRLLVRGSRIENLEEVTVKRATADAVRIQPILVAPMLAAPILLVLLIGVLWPKPKKYRRDDL